MFPLHIAESIVDCIVGVSSPLLIDVKYDDYDERLLLLMPLLGVCRMFRSIVYSRYCQSYKIQLDYAEDTAIHYFSSWPPCLKQPNHPMHHLVKGIIVELDLWEILDGKALEMLSGGFDADSIFPLARKLTLQLASFTPGYLLQELFDEHNPLAALANIGEFVQRLRRMAPRLGKIGVEVGTELHDWPRSIRPYFGSLVAQLFQLVTCVEFDSYDWLVLTATHVNAISNLVRIKYHVGGTTNLLLLRANAATLQHIDIALINGGYVTGLVRDDIGEYIQYPWLYTLSLYYTTIDEESVQPIFPGAIPFPRLRHLHMENHYAFGDDTPFRGNVATLECLKLYVDKQAIEILHRCNVFVSPIHLHLRRVSIRITDNSTPEGTATNMPIMSQVLGVSDIAAVHGMSGVVSSTGNYSRIQVLSLDGVRLALWDVVVLVEKLPLLSELFSRCDGLGTMPDGVTWTRLPAYMRSMYAPLSIQFRRWNLGRGSKWSNMGVIECLLLLALVCPNLCFKSPDPSAHNELRTNMAIVVAMNRYRYYSTLSRLL